MFIVAHNGSAVLGGGETGTAKLLAALQERGHRVLMLCRDRDMARRVGELGIPTAVLRLGGAAMLPDALRFAAAMRRLRPDALILTTFKKVFLAALGARLAHVPLVVQRVVLSGDVPRRAAYRWAIRRHVHLVTLNSEAMRAPFLRADDRLAPASVRTVHDGVRAPARPAVAGALRRSLGIPERAPVIGAVARLAEQKRLDRLVRALATLADAHLVVAGEGPHRARLEALAKELDVSERLHLLGFRDDVGAVLDALDLYVVSSDREGMANAMLEAMAFGLPVVSTDVSGAREALRADASGVAPGVVVGFDEAELVAALAALLRDDPGRLAMGAAARRVAESRFGWERFVHEWEALLSSGARR